MPASAKINNALQEFCDTTYKTSTQHKEVGISHLQRDQKDTFTLYTFLQERKPFEETETSLHNIDTGATADIGVNVDDAKTIGAAAIDNMIDQNINKYSFKKSQQAVTLNVNTFAKVTHDVISAFTVPAFDYSCR